jgi:TonB family protein
MIGRVPIAWMILTCPGVLAQSWQPERIVGLEYPKSALILGLDGVVEIECYVDNDGNVVRAEVARADPQSRYRELASAAARNAMLWKFGRPRSGEDRYKLTYHFQIQSVPLGKDVPGFRFKLPGQVFVTADKKVAERQRSRTNPHYDALQS